MPAAIIFDLDGVLIDSETVWDAARRELAAQCGRAWPEEATRAMMGMSAREWSRYMHDELGVPLPPEEIVGRVVADLGRRYRDELPLIPGAVQAVERVASRWPLGLASSANREIIDVVLERAGLRQRFRATVSADEVPRGKPAPDVYLEVARRLAVESERCLAVEDSANGLRSAVAAGLKVIAVPNRAFPPDPESLALAVRVIESIERLDPELVAATWADANAGAR